MMSLHSCLLAASLLSSVQGAVDEYVGRQMAECHIPGLALGIVKDDAPFYVHGYSREPGASITPQTPFILGSVSKSFTALAVMQLVDEGKVDLDEAVDRYLPGFRATLDGKPASVTVRQLLNQSSGVPPYFDNTVVEAVTIEQLLVTRLGRSELRHPPGTAFTYSNANFIILGRMIEAVTGMSYRQCLEQRVFKPLEMSHSWVSKREALRDGLAAGHRMWFGFPLEADLPYFESSLPAGYVISCAEDMTHYLAALMNGGVHRQKAVVSASGAAELLRPGVKAYVPVGVEATETWYAMGWMVNLVGTRVDTVSHTGETANYHAHAIMRPQQRLAVIVLDNLSGLITAGQIAPGVLKIMAGEPIPDRPVTARRIVRAFNAISATSLILLLASGLRLRTFRARIRRGGARLAINVGVAFVINIVLPVLILWKVPELAQAPWRAIAFFSPDLSLVLIGVPVMLLVLGAAKIRLLWVERV